MTHSVLPFQPKEPSTCPYPPKAAPPSARDARSYSALLLLLAPVDPAYVRRCFPQLLLLHGEGLGGQMREKLGSRLVTRLLLGRQPAAASQGHDAHAPAHAPRW